MEAPYMSETDEDFKLDSNQCNDEWILERGRMLSKKQFLRIVGKDKKINFMNSSEKPLIWSYLAKRNSNSYKNFHI